MPPPRVVKPFHLALFVLVAMARPALTEQSLSSRSAALGELIVTQFQSAPFPHSQRTNGHTYKDKNFPADKHYSDSTVAIFIPKKFRETDKTDFVVHFHGWYNNVSNVFRQYELAEQLIEANRNAILVVPEGPRNAPDSFGGKLEDADGFKKFMAEVLQTLHLRGKLPKSEVGRVILSGHSGGYHIISAILDRGGMTEQIKEVWLFDALYGQTEKFTNWFGKAGDIRLLNIYTENGGTKKETENLIADLKTRSTTFLATTENQIWPQQLQTNRLVFIFTGLAHDEVLNKDRTFREFLLTSCFADTKANAFVPPPKRDVPGQREKISLGGLYVPEFFKPSTNGATDVVMFFHGAAWCAEQNFYDTRKNAVLVSISHSNYAALFADTNTFLTLLNEVTNTLAKKKIPQRIGRICLASFSGGYSAVREILKQPNVASKISDVVLADSLYAPRASGQSNELDPIALAPFLQFARRAADGKCNFWFSQLFPWEEKYRDNTTTLAANYLIEQVGAERRAADSRNSRGVRILYRADKGNFHVLGYAGMTNQDHFEHFYGLSDLLREISFANVPSESATK